MKNHFTRNLVLSILEILCVFPITVICGIVACVFTAKSNTSYLDNRMEDFKAQTKKAAISLWIGFAFMMIIAFLVGTMVISDRLLQKQYEEEKAATQTMDTTEEVPLEDTVMAGYYEFTLQGTKVSLPIEYEKFISLGFRLASFSDDTRMINPDTSEFVCIVDENSNLLCDIYVYNDEKQAKPFKECTIISVETEVPEIELMNGFTFDTSKEEVLEYFGQPDDEYVSEDSNYQVYEWHAPSYQRSGWDLINITFSEDAVSKIKITYCGERGEQ